MNSSTSPAGHPAELAGTAEELCRAWYESFGRAIYSYVRFHVASADLAEDVTAETFLKALRSAGRFDPAKGDARVWLFRIAQNTLRDTLRQSRVRRHVSLGAMRDLVSETPSPEERLLWEEEVANLLDAIKDLPAGDRDLLSLRYGSGMDSAAIGDLLGIRESAVRTRVWRALRRLRGILQEDR